MSVKSRTTAIEAGSYFLQPRQPRNTDNSRTKYPKNWQNDRISYIRDRQHVDHENCDDPAIDHEEDVNSDVVIDAEDGFTYFAFEEFVAIGAVEMCHKS